MLAQIIGSIAENAAECISEEDYTAEDGLIYCGKCHTPKQTVVEGMKPYIKDGIVPCACECQQRAEQQRQTEKQELERRIRIEELRRHCLGGGLYAKLNFSADDGHRADISEICRQYAAEFAENRARGRGLMLMGPVGTGKTFYACCIANALIDKGIRAWVTTMQPLLRACGDFSRDEQTFQRIMTEDMLVLDDFGTTRLTERNLELLFEIIDTRYRSGLPLIVTTNLAPADLRSDRNSIELVRIYDRLLSMCVGADESGKIVLDGQSMRRRAV